jgi:biopolymer transport protein ExbB
MAENPSMPGVSVPIRARPGAGEYRYLRYAWRKRGGGSATLQLAGGGDWEIESRGVKRSMKYAAGQAADAAAVLVQSTLPDEWTVVTRDLFADFGETTITGLRIGCPDGEYILLDGMRFFRSLDDLEPTAN